MNPVFTCELCGAPASEAAHLCLDLTELAALRLWLEAEALTVAEVLDSTRDPIRWRLHHDACVVHGGEPRYRIGIERLGSIQSVLAWTMHLAAKGWLEETDWSEVLERVHALIAGPLP